MKISFKNILNISQHLYVIHQTCNINNSILKKVSNNDILFFDDCLYSQYVFIKENISFLHMHKIACVLGFSAGIFRKNCTPIYNAICSDYHNRIHNNDSTAFSAYMSIDEIKDLLIYDNVYLACHGNMHLNLKELTKSKKEQCKLFLNDIEIATKNFHKYGFTTNIFIYPYAYDNFLLSDYIVKKFGYIHIFAGKNTQRIPIENLMYNII